MLLTAEDFEDRNAVIVLITTGNLEGRQEVVDRMDGDPGDK